MHAVLKGKLRGAVNGHPTIGRGNAYPRFRLDVGMLLKGHGEPGFDDYVRIAQTLLQISHVAQDMAANVAVRIELGGIVFKRPLGAAHYLQFAVVDFDS
jgi:hypothetical protein